MRTEAMIRSNLARRTGSVTPRSVHPEPPASQSKVWMHPRFSVVSRPHIYTRLTDRSLTRASEASTGSCGLLGSLPSTTLAGLLPLDRFDPALALLNGCISVGGLQCNRSAEAVDSLSEVAACGDLVHAEVPARQ